MKTERVTLLISPAEKAMLAAKAEKSGVTVSELMRQAALGFEPAEEDARTQLAILSAELQQALARLKPKLALAYAEADLTREHIDRREADMQAALHALEKEGALSLEGVQWLFGLGADMADDGAASAPPSFAANVDRVIRNGAAKRKRSLAEIAHAKMASMVESADPASTAEDERKRRARGMEAGL